MELSETDIFVCCILIGIVFLFCSVRLYFRVIRPFLDARDYIKVELRRSQDNEYYYWKRELKNLYLRHIPIFGRLIRRLMR